MRTTAVAGRADRSHRPGGRQPRRGPQGPAQHLLGTRRRRRISAQDAQHPKRGTKRLEPKWLRRGRRRMRSMREEEEEEEEEEDKTDE